MVAAFNIADSFRAYSFYDPSTTPLIIGAVLAAAFAVCIFGGSKQISKITGVLVPVMGIFYILVSLVIIVTHLNLVPQMFADSFTQAFDFKAIFGGFTGSAIMQGIKRGLFSNEAGVGSAPNAAASAGVSHPVKQGLVQMLSVYIDTIVICSATAFMLLCSGIEPSTDLQGMPYVQAAVANYAGKLRNDLYYNRSGFCFAFTTLIGNFYYAEMGLGYICDKTPNKALLMVFRLAAALIVCFGATMEFSVAWNTADVLMGLMAIINLPVILILATAVRCMNDYLKQKKEGKNPVFKAKDIDLETKTDFWN